MANACSASCGSSTSPPAPSDHRTRRLKTAYAGSRVRAGATFKRDHFCCRYCGGRVVPVAVMSVLSHLFPEQLPFVHTYKNVHPMYWTRGAEADHIEPGSRGGDSEAAENHATACVRCNTAKSDNQLQDIGWRLLDPSTADWDGLTNWYRQLWEQAGQPHRRYHAPWLKALTTHA